MMFGARVLAAAAVVVALGVSSARAETPSPIDAAGQSTAATSPRAIIKEDLEAFFDGTMPYALAQGDIAGAVISIVKDGEIIFAKGYGYADVATRKPVEADQTLFRPGSVAKLFTWTAVMQMVEQGKLDLDADINTYLDFRIPDAFGAPITMRQIMAHSAGFEELATDLFVEKAENLRPIGDYVKKNIPARIYPPGKIVAYSNYSTTIAGYVVERLSGEPYNDYVANHILKPLGMTRSTFAQPLPKDLEPGMSLGYDRASNPKTVPFELAQVGPAGGMSATATDMARFMLAHLGGGALGDARILSPETTKLMHSRTFSWAPGINGFAHGFYEENRNGQRIVGHAGDIHAFHSDLHLMLDANVGFFISFNSMGKEGASGSARVEIFRAFLDRYFPYAPPVDVVADTLKADAQRVVGSYTATRRKESALRFFWLVGQVNVSAEPNGDIKVDALTDHSGAPKLWRQIGPLRYREVGGQAQIVFVADEATGRIQYFTTDEFIPVALLQRTADLEQTSLFGPLTLGALGVFAFAFAVWIGGWLMRLRFGRPLAMTPHQLTWRLLSRVGVVLFLAAGVGWLAYIVAASADNAILFGSGAGMLMVLYVIGAAAIFGGMAIVVNAAQRLAGGPGGILARGGELVLAVAAIYGIWALVNYGLVSFNTVV
jgi:CubicO group peptidase (beta-lactamase class C family)